MKSLLIGEGASPEAIRRIEQALLDCADNEVTTIIHMRTLHLGPEELLVAAKIGVAAQAAGADIVRVIDEAEARVRAVEPVARVIYLEPDLPR
jgi:divalent metal cation (Fe/Co/Zn/Cd) transporter